MRVPQNHTTPSRKGRLITLGLILILAASAFAEGHRHKRYHGEKRWRDGKHWDTRTTVVTQGRVETTHEIRIEPIRARFEFRIEAWRDVGYRCQREREFRTIRNVYTDYTEQGDQIEFVRNECGTREHYYRDARMVSYDIEGPDGKYHYFENDEMVSIDDNRFGQKKHVYYRK